LSDDRAEASWSHFDHAADMGVRGVGATLDEAFEQAALAMMAIITSADVMELTAVEVQCCAPDAELLLVDWLNALIFEMATRQMLFGRFNVLISARNGELRLTAQARGEPVDRSRHQPAVEIKGATYTALDVRRDADGWLAQCVVDV
jgi:tRNA nucleotidyltransferase (CCA-adding enzyme)